MYSFYPTADIPADHGGLFIVGMVCVTWLVITLMNDPSEFFAQFFLVTVVMVFGYFVSFQWTDQTPKTFKNEKVTAEFVGFQPEGYREKSGKSMVDKHNMYVVYSVNGDPVILQGQPGQTYPQTVILYKN